MRSCARALRSGRYKVPGVGKFIGGKVRKHWFVNNGGVGAGPFKNLTNAFFRSPSASPGFSVPRYIPSGGRDIFRKRKLFQAVSYKIYFLSGRPSTPPPASRSPSFSDSDRLPAEIGKPDWSSAPTSLRRK